MSKGLRLFNSQFLYGLKRYASSATQTVSSRVESVEKISRLPNGLTVASIDLGGAVSQFVIAYRAGARYQEPTEAGLVHHLRNMVGTDSKNFSSVQMLWQCGSAGANLAASATRDVFAVKMSVLRDQAPYALSLLGEFALPALKPWDLEDQYETLIHDRAYLQAHDILMEKLHYAAFREGSLGTRLYAKSKEIGKITYKQLENFAASRLVSGEATLVGVNVEHDYVLDYASHQFPIAEGSRREPSMSPYLGGEVRHKQNMKNAHVAIIGQGASLKDPKALATQAVLSAAIGQGASVKHPSMAGFGLVSSAVFKASNCYPFGLSAINEIYSDNGMVGLYLVGNGDRISPLVRAAVDALKSFNIGETDLQKAKNIARLNIILRTESSEHVAMDLAEQLLANDQTLSTADFLSMIDSVSSAEVNEACRRLTSKLTLASHGDVRHVPYLDEL